MRWCGDGKYLKDVEKLALNYNIADKVQFSGNVSKTNIYRYLNESDLFVLASRTEGMPRVVIEAMSVGLPIVATKVGGIPEILEDKVLVEINNAQALADKILEIISNENLYNEQALRNFEESKSYSEKVLKNKRHDFYSYIIKNL